jgi:hypothetical protein
MRISDTLVFCSLILSVNFSHAEDITAVTTDKLARDWSNNQLAAEMKYSKKPLHLTGMVDRISSAGDRYYVALDAAGTFLGISVYARPDALDKVAELQKGQTITMYCENFEDVISYQCHNGYVMD